MSEKKWTGRLVPPWGRLVSCYVAGAIVAIMTTMTTTTTQAEYVTLWAMAEGGGITTLGDDGDGSGDEGPSPGDCTKCEEWSQSPPDCVPLPEGAAVDGEPCKECDGEGGVRDKADGPSDNCFGAEDDFGDNFELDWDLGILPTCEWEASVSGTMCVCCKDGALDSAVLHGTLQGGGSAGCAGNVPIAGKKFKFKDLGFDKENWSFGVNGEANLGMSADIGINGSLDATVSKDCEGEECLEFSGEATGSIDAEGGLSWELKVTARLFEILQWEKSLDGDITPVQASTSVAGGFSYDCETGFEGDLCYNELKVELSLSVSIQEWELVIWEGKEYVLLEGNCE